MISSLEVGAVFRIQDMASAPLKEIAAQLNTIQAAIDRVKGGLVELAESKFPGLTRSLGTLVQRMDALGVSAQKGADGVERAFTSLDTAVGTSIGRIQALKAELASIRGPSAAVAALSGSGAAPPGIRARGHGGGGGGFHAREAGIGPIGVHGGLAGMATGFSLWEAIKASADLQQVQANLAASGVSKAEIEKATSFAYGFSGYGMTARDVLQSINEVRNPLNKGTSADAGVEAAMRHMPTLASAAAVLKAQGGPKGGDTARELYDLVKSAEFRNAIGDREFDAAINAMVKADVATGGIVTPGTFLQMSQMLKAALPGLSDQYLYGIMPELAQEFRGRQAGTAAASLYQQLISGQMRTKGINLLADLGMVDKSKVEFNSIGMIKAAKPGFFTDSDVFRSNPMQGVADIIAAMNAHGITDVDKQRDYFSQMFGNRNAAQMALTLGYQYPRLQRGAQGIGNTLDIGAISPSLMANNPFTQWSQFTSSLTNFLALVGGELMPSATSALKNLTSTLQALIDLFSGKGASWSLLTGSGGQSFPLFGAVEDWLKAHGLRSWFGGGASSGSVPAFPNSSMNFFEQRGGSGLDYTGMNSTFTSRLQAALTAAEKATGQPARITSMHRSSALQAWLYARYRAGLGGLAAPPGHSQHEIGDAADLAAGADLDWLHSHAGDFGLEFLPGHAGAVDPGHIQLNDRVLSQPSDQPGAVHHVTVNIDGRKVATAVQRSIVDSNTQVRGPSNFDGRSIPTPVDSGFQYNF